MYIGTTKYVVYSSEHQIKEQLEFIEMFWSHVPNWCVMKEAWLVWYALNMLKCIQSSLSDVACLFKSTLTVPAWRESSSAHFTSILSFLFIRVLLTMPSQSYAWSLNEISKYDSVRLLLCSCKNCSRKIAKFNVDLNLVELWHSVGSKFPMRAWNSLTRKCWRSSMWHFFSTGTVVLN